MLSIQELEVLWCNDGVKRQDRFAMFSKLLLLEKPSECLLYLDSIGKLKLILPELVVAQNVQQNSYHCFDVYYHSLYTCDAAPQNNLKLRLAGLMHDLGKVPAYRVVKDGEPTFHNHEILGVSIGKKILARFGVPHNLSSQVCFLIRHHMFYYTEEWTDRAVRRFLNKVNEHQFEDLIALRQADRIGSGKRKSLPKEIHYLKAHIEQIKQADNELKIRNLQINGYFLMEMGMNEGPLIGKLLHILLNEVRNETLANEQTALQKRARQLWQCMNNNNHDIKDYHQQLNYLQQMSVQKQ